MKVNITLLTMSTWAVRVSMPPELAPAGDEPGCGVLDMEKDLEDAPHRGAEQNRWAVGWRGCPWPHPGSVGGSGATARPTPVTVRFPRQCWAQRTFRQSP